jgi:hypothetical protein
MRLANGFFVGCVCSRYCWSGSMAEAYNSPEKKQKMMVRKTIVGKEEAGYNHIQELEHRHLDVFIMISLVMFPLFPVNHSPQLAIQPPPPVPALPSHPQAIALTPPSLPFLCPTSSTTAVPGLLISRTCTASSPIPNTPR